MISYSKLQLHRFYSDDHNPTHFFWKELIEQHHCPFIKKDLILVNPDKKAALDEIFSVLSNTTKYPLDLIEQLIIDSFSYHDQPAVPLKVLVICHIFFPDLAFELFAYLTPLQSENTIFIFNLSERLAVDQRFLNIVEKVFPGSYVLSSPNKGRDIGGKLSALNLAHQLNIFSDITLIIHDKKSLHLEGGQLWRAELFKILEPQHLKKVFSLFMEKKEVGIVCSKKFIQNEYSPDSKNFFCTSNQLIKKLIKQYDIVTTNYDFVAGNIFWIRSGLLNDFFNKRSITSIKADLEKGNALDFGNGTYIHAWERIMSWIASSQGYILYGL